MSKIRAFVISKPHQSKVEEVAHPQPGQGEITIYVKLQDTVGAGDSFAAAVAHHYLRGSNLKTINEVANRLGAYVA